MTNPYLSDDDDEDLLGDEAPKTSPARGNTRVEFRGPGGEQLSPELQKALGEYFKDYQPNMKGIDIIPGIMGAISGMYEYFADITKYRQNGPLVAAMAEIMDEVTNGRLNMIYMLKEAERKIVSIHTVKRHINLFLMSRQADAVQNEVAHEMMAYFASLGKLCDFIQGRAVKLYYDLCAKLEREPDEVMVESGFYTTVDTYTRASLGNPPAKKEVR